MVDVAHLRRPGIRTTHARRISDRGPKLFPYRLWRFEQVDRVAERFGHFRLAIEPHDALRGRQQSLGLREETRRLELSRTQHALSQSDVEPRVPLARDLARQLQVLYLIFADGHQIGAVQ